MKTRRKEYEFAPAADKTTMHDVALQIWNATRPEEPEKKADEPVKKEGSADDSLAKVNAFTGVNDTNKKEPLSVRFNVRSILRLQVRTKRRASWTN